MRTLRHYLSDERGATTVGAIGSMPFLIAILAIAWDQVNVHLPHHRNEAAIRSVCWEILRADDVGSEDALGQVFRDRGGQPVEAARLTRDGRRFTVTIDARWDRTLALLGDVTARYRCSVTGPPRMGPDHPPGLKDLVLGWN